MWEKASLELKIKKRMVIITLFTLAMATLQYAQGEGTIFCPCQPTKPPITPTHGQKNSFIEFILGLFSIYNAVTSEYIVLKVVIK